MPPPSIVGPILELLEPWLDAMVETWFDQKGAQRPTLPHTNDMKVDVRGIVAALGLKQHQEQHFFKKPVLRDAVNVVAIQQGLKPIGSRTAFDAVEKPVAERLARSERSENEMTRTLAEREMVIQDLRGRIRALEAQLGLLEETGMTLRVPPAA